MPASGDQAEVGLPEGEGRSRKRAKDFLIICFFLLLPLLYFWRVITPELKDQASIAQGDFIEVFYPFRHFVAAELWAGRIPLWNPYIYGGQPGLADIQEGALYPPGLMTILLTAREGLPVKALEWEVILHFSLAGLFTYLFVRRLLGSRFAGMVAALTFAYGGYLTSFPVTQLGILETAIWLPLVLYFLHLGLERGTKFFLMAGLAWAFSLLAGHPQTSMYLLYTCLAFLGYCYFSQRKRVDGRRFLAQVALFVACGVGLAAIQLVPTLEFMGLSQRAEVAYSFTEWGFRLTELSAFLVPVELGGLALYVGILPLILAVGAILLDRTHRDRLLWGGLALFSLLASLGGSTFFYSLLHLALPGYGRVRNQERGILIFSFAVAVLAGYGARFLTLGVRGPGKRDIYRLFRFLWRTLGWLVLLDALLYYGWLAGNEQMERVISRYNFTLLIFAFALGILHIWLRGSLRERGFQGLIVACLVLDLFTTSWKHNLTTPKPEGHFPLTPALTLIKGDEGSVFRIQSEGLLPHNGNASMVYQLEDLTGNSPLHLETYSQFLERVKDEWTWWQLFNVKYALSHRHMGRAGMALLGQDGDIYLYQVANPLPRAFVVHGVRPAQNAEEAWALLNSPQFDPRQEVVVEGVLAPHTLSSPRGAVPSQVHILQHSPQKLRLWVQAGADGFLVLGQRYYPGWRATVDGEKVPILKANAIFQALWLPAGEHWVEMIYAPLSFKLGLGLSLITLFGLTSFLLWEAIPSWRRRRASSTVDGPPML